MKSLLEKDQTINELKRYYAENIELQEKIKTFDEILNIN